MAAAFAFVCGNCRHEIEAWDDGNPYYIDELGRKKYAYHPNHEELARCIGNDSPHLCLSCGKQFNVDSRAPRDSCPKCRGTPITPTWELEGKPCPFCKAGTFAMDPHMRAIS